MGSLAALLMKTALIRKARRSEDMSKAGIRKLFGTDGIRGIAGESPLDAKTIYATGLALGHSLRGKAEPKVLLGRDTRESSPGIAATIAAALRETGVRVESAGVVPTPAVAFLARTHGFDAGVVISASHNPWRDNGIKLFGPDGFKLPDATELAMENEIVRHAEEAEVPDAKELPPIEDNSALKEHYIQFLMDCVPGLSLQGLRMVADCANGAAAAVAPELFAKLGARIPDEVAVLNVAPNGRNINEDCGALHPERVAAEVQRRGAPMGVTFDGDADRCMLAGAHGNVINGDAILLMAGRDLKTRGLLTALVVLDLVARTRKTVDELIGDLKVFPQVIVNVKVREKKPLEGIPAVADRIHAAEEELRDSGRVVIRYSGTEALARVMIEAESQEAMRRHADAIADAIRAELGV